MPNTKSAIRRVRRVKKQTQVNRIRKSKYKNAVKQMELLIKNKEKDKAKKYFSKFQSILMQVAKSGVINKNTASRKISRISKKISSKRIDLIYNSALKNGALGGKVLGAGGGGFLLLYVTKNKQKLIRRKFKKWF